MSLIAGGVTPLFPFEQICRGENCADDSMRLEWFRCFRDGDFDVEDKELMALLHEELAKSLGVAQTAIAKRTEAL